jgi:uncharacterized membrane protein YqaE (UPF0057 family)
MKILLIILCFILPPLAVYLATKCVKSTIINVILCFLFYIPGLIHALWTVLKGAPSSPAAPTTQSAS